MRLNREKAALLLAVLIAVVGIREVVLAVVAPTGPILLVDPVLPPSRHGVLVRHFRQFKSAEEVSRNPFTFSEGWQSIDILPMDVPPLGAPPRPIPGLSSAPVADMPGTTFVERPATPRTKGTGGS